MPSETVSGHQAVSYAPLLSPYAVMEALLSMAVGIDHLLCPVLFSHPGKDTVALPEVGGRIMQEHDEP